MRIFENGQENTINKPAAKTLALDKILQWTGAELVSKGMADDFSAVCTDSRKVVKNGLFVALIGETFNGNRFAFSALENGAAGAVVSERMEPVPGKTILYVPDTLEALQRLAQGYRREFSARTVAITGSVGKTTTKDVLHWCLSFQGKTLKTQVNQNNDIGVPLTVLQLDASYQMAVIEMGMRALGEIERLCRVVQPDVALITNIAPVHLETLGTLENIAKAKCEIFSHFQPDGWGMIWGDSALLLQTARKSGRRFYTFGKSDACDCCLQNIKLNENGMTMQVRLFAWEGELFFPLPSEAIAMDVLAAAGCACRLGMKPELIQSALAAYSGDAQRLHIENFEEGGLVLNDTYNANPLSMAAALEFLQLKSAGRRRIAVLGDMYELGSLEQEGHLEVGRKAAACQLDCLVTIGALGKLIAEGAAGAGMLSEKIKMFPDREQALPWLQQNVSRKDAVLFKSSHGLHLDLLLRQWKNGGENHE